MDTLDLLPRLLTTAFSLCLVAECSPSEKRFSEAGVWRRCFPDERNKAAEELCSKEDFLNCASKIDILLYAD